jgi:hypothetical protein
MPFEVPYVPGRRLVDLVNELERRLSGVAPGPGLEAELAARIPRADTYVLVLFDGLGHDQLNDRGAGSLRAASAGVIDAAFPTTTTVSLSSVATGLSPASHGVIAHLMWIPELDRVVNTLKWVTLQGQRFDYATQRLLPAPNLWERLSAAGCEPITVQPGDFATTPLTRALYRGCRFEPVWSPDEAVAATAELARLPGRLIFTYFPQVDFAAHVWGRRSPEYQAAVSLVDTAWSRLCATLPSHAVAVGTADHGHLDYAEGDKILIRGHDSLTFYGDARIVYVRGAESDIDRMCSEVGVEPVRPDPETLWPGVGTVHPELAARLPDALVAAPPGRILLPPAFDRRLVGYHGGVDPAEVEIPLLVGGRAIG